MSEVDRRSFLRTSLATAAAAGVARTALAQGGGEGGGLLLARTYTNANYTGPRFDLTGSNWFVGSDELAGHPVRSVRVPGSPEHDVLMFLFDAMPGGAQIPYLGFEQHGIAPGLPAVGDFAGRFIQVTNRKGDASGTVQARLPNHGWSSTPTYGNRWPLSAMAVRARRRSEIRWWTSRILPFVWNQVLEFVLRSLPLPVRVAADPLETLWLPFPHGAPGQMSSDRMYLVVHQGLKVQTPVRNVQCCLNCYLEVGIDDNRRFQMVRRYSDSYVWRGSAAGEVANGLQGAKAAWDFVWDTTPALVNFLTNIPADEAYLLPGSQDVLSTPDGVTHGHVNRDHATLVVLPPPGAGRLTGPSYNLVFAALDELVKKLTALFGSYFDRTFPSITINSGVVNSSHGRMTEEISRINDNLGR